MREQDLLETRIRNNKIIPVTELVNIRIEEMKKMMMQVNIDKSKLMTEKEQEGKH